MKTSCLIRNMLLVGSLSLTLASCGGGGGGGGGESSSSGNDSTTNTPSVQDGYAPNNLSGCTMTYNYDGKPYTFMFDSSGEVEGTVRLVDSIIRYEGTYSYSRAADGQNATLVLNTTSGTTSAGIEKTQTFDIELSFSSSTKATALVSYTNTDSVNGNAFYDGEDVYSVTATFSGVGVQGSDSSNTPEADNDASTDSSDSNTGTTDYAPASLTNGVLRIVNGPNKELLDGQEEHISFLSSSKSVWCGEYASTYTYTKKEDVPNSATLTHEFTYMGHKFKHNLVLTFISSNEVRVSGSMSMVGGGSVSYISSSANYSPTGASAGNSENNTVIDYAPNSTADFKSIVLSDISGRTYYFGKSYVSCEDRYYYTNGGYSYRKVAPNIVQLTSTSLMTFYDGPYLIQARGIAITLTFKDDGTAYVDGIEMAGTPSLGTNETDISGHCSYTINK